MTIMTTYGPAFWKQMPDRLIKSAAAGAVLGIGDAAVAAGALDIRSVDFESVAGFIGGAVLVSLVLNIITAKPGGQITASAVPAEAVLVKQTPSGLAVAGAAYLERSDTGQDVPEGTPVRIEEIAPSKPTDDDADEPHVDIEDPPPGFDDGSLRE